jgi:very-short-patch-repair endonuclease
MDFLLLLPGRRRVVVEVDGAQHYSENDKPSPRLYAEMVREDRALRLAGYEMYRFGGAELPDLQGAADLLHPFFDELLRTR